MSEVKCHKSILMNGITVHFIENDCKCYERKLYRFYIIQKKRGEKEEDNECNLVYVGSTTKRLDRRFVDHKSGYKTGVGRVRSYVLFEKYGVDECEIILLEEREVCENESLKIEGEYIRKYRGEGICVNRKIAGRSKNEYNDENKIEICEKMKIHHEKLKPDINLKRRERYENDEEYRENIKLKEREKGKQRVSCSHCNGDFSRGSLSRHIRRKHPLHRLKI